MKHRIDDAYLNTLVEEDSDSLQHCDADDVLSLVEEVIDSRNRSVKYEALCVAAEAYVESYASDELDIPERFKALRKALEAVKHD